MHSAANHMNRFLISSFSLNEAAGPEPSARPVGLCQKVILSHLARCSRLSNSRQLFTSLADELIRLAEYNIALRDTDALAEASQALMHLPISSAQKAGQYYQAFNINRKGKPNEAKLLLEVIADDAPPAYRARAMQTLGRIYYAERKVEQSLRLYLESLRVVPKKSAMESVTTLMAHWEISIVKSIFGDHRGALNSLENLTPLVRFTAQYNSFYYYLHHNSLAVELGELGRVAEAEAAIAVALNSPYAAIYPEWTETRDELAAKRQSANPSQVAVSRSLPIEAEPKSQQRQQDNLQIVFYLRLSNSQEILILRVIGTATGQTHHCLFILDRLEETLQPRAPPSCT